MKKSEMSLPDLKEYFQMVINVEQNIFMQGKLNYRLCQKIQSLGNEAKIAKPELSKGDETVTNVIEAIGLVVGLIVFFYAFFMADDGYTAIGGIILSILLPIFSYLIGKWLGKKTVEPQNNFLQAAYEQEVAKDRMRVAQENAKKRFLENDRKMLLQQMKESRKTLEQLYSADIIYPKYRNLPMVCTLYEYLSSGRCTALEGPNGGYNMLETEIRMDRVIVQLDEIIARLGQIQQNQFMLYSAVQEGNKKMDEIMSRMDRMASTLNNISVQEKDYTNTLNELAKNSAITAYHAERVDQELAYINRMNYYAGKYDDVGPFRSIPPTW